MQATQKTNKVFAKTRHKRQTQPRGTKEAFTHKYNKGQTEFREAPNTGSKMSPPTVTTRINDTEPPRTL